MYIFKEDGEIKGTARACPKSEEGEDIEGWHKADTQSEFDAAVIEIESK